ncbi:8.6 kDa transglutaminase substrate-like [Haemaphysalis longicornis]
MKAAVILLLVVLVAAVCVSATSPPNCRAVDCATVKCAKPTCPCGSHKDACGCCDFCNKCAGQECVPLHQDRCADGQVCELNEPGTFHHGGKGTCKPPTSA